MQGPKPLTPQQLRSVRQPIEVAIMTGHYFGDDYGREITGCSLGSIPLNCSFIPDRSKPYLGNINEVSRASDAVWWHAPNTCMLPVGLYLDKFFSHNWLFLNGSCIYAVACESTSI